MPRLIPEILRIEQNQLASTHPFAFLAELDYGAGVERITNEPQGIIFQGLQFAGDVPLGIRQFTEAGLTESVRMAISIGNAAQNAVALCEQHWITQLNPVWTATLWYVDATQPDVLPLQSNVGIYEVLSVLCDEINGEFELYEPSISTTRGRPDFTVTAPLFPFARTRT